jgi:hypothetical protein
LWALQPSPAPPSSASIPFAYELEVVVSGLRHHQSIARVDLRVLRTYVVHQPKSSRRGHENSAIDKQINKMQPRLDIPKTTHTMTYITIHYLTIPYHTIPYHTMIPMLPCSHAPTLPMLSNLRCMSSYYRVSWLMDSRAVLPCGEGLVSIMVPPSSRCHRLLATRAFPLTIVKLFDDFIGLLT